VGAHRAAAAELERQAEQAFSGSSQVLNGIVYRLRTGCPWRDLPGEFGPWQTVWKRHARFCRDGTWDRIHQRVLADADAVGEIDWQLAMDSTISRVHQHAATLPREVVADLPPHTGGGTELQETHRRAG
jgi:transposase